jgi:hypothetical protein
MNGKQNPVFQSAPTGITAYAITGKTLHSLLHLPVRGKMSDLSTSTLQFLQALFRDYYFLMIDEKSIVDLKMFLLIDDWLRVIFPATSHRPFGGINILICGDFYQLPSVGGSLSILSGHYTSMRLRAIKSHQLYQAFDETIRLTEIIRKLEDDLISI